MIFAAALPVLVLRVGDLYRVPLRARFHLAFDVEDVAAEAADGQRRVLGHFKATRWPAICDRCSAATFSEPYAINAEGAPLLCAALCPLT